MIFTIEVNPKNLLDTKIVLNNERVVKAQVYRKENKEPAPWISRIPKRYKRSRNSRTCIDLERKHQFLILRFKLSKQNAAHQDIQDDLSKVLFEVSLHLLTKNYLLLFHLICLKLRNRFRC